MFSSVRFQCAAQGGQERGFTLVELLVSIGIVVLVMAIVLVHQSTLNNIILLKSQTFQLATDIRRAQVAGVSGAGSQTTDPSSFGIYIDNTNTSAPYYVFFDDTNGDYRYQSGESISASGIDPRFKIKSICDEYGNNCASTATVIFKRPNFDAHLDPNTSTGVSTIGSLMVTFQSRSGIVATSSVHISGAGQIYVQ